jgi:acetyl-CoA synthetase
MTWNPIEKPAGALRVSPHLRDYEKAAAAFRWSVARAALAGLPGGRGLNIAHEAVDRHAGGERAEQTALRCLGKGDARRDITYAELRDQTNRFANLLERLGVARGDRVFVLTGRIYELYVSVLGALKAGAIVSPLFSAFGPEPILARMQIAAPRLLVTTEALYERKILGLRPHLPFLEHVLLVRDAPCAGPFEGVHDLAELLEDSNPGYDIPPTAPEDPALLHFTSGTTGKPKGALHVHEAVVAHHLSGRLVLDLHEEDIYWCTADPGWVTGTSYGIIAPLTNGVTSIVEQAEFDVERWYRVLEEQKVTVWYTAPTAIRMLMKAGLEAARGHDFSALRFMASVGEPLNPEAVVWGLQAFGQPFHDNWWQTETGGIMVANYASMTVRPGSMGKPLPGIDARIVADDQHARLHFIEEPMVQGELALRAGWPSMFRAYWKDPERYDKCFRDGWYLTGDLAKRDADGYFWFVGRKDDVIKTSGHLIGPFEVESLLMEHRAVAEAGVIGKPDPAAFEIIKAFIALRPGFEPGDALSKEILAFARTRLGAVVAPKEIEFVPSLPKTRSGKIMRRLLKARELGFPEGDTSTLETAS